MNMTGFIRLLFALVVIVTGLSFWLFYNTESYYYLFIGIFFLFAGLFSIGVLMTLSLFQKDKKIDYDMVEKFNYHLVDCPECGQENIKEDQYCRFCGEKLEGEQNV